MRQTIASSMLVAACCLCLAAAAGCGPQGGRVSLTYLTLGGPSQVCSQPVGVAWFEDARGSEAIGRNGEEDLFPRSMGVSTWVTDALVKELSARGCRVEAATEGSPFAPEVMLHGRIGKLFLTRDDLHFVMDMALKVKLVRDNKTFFEKDYKGQWERTAAPTEDVYEEMYRQGLGDLLTSVAQDVAEQLR